MKRNQIRPGDISEVLTPTCGLTVEELAASLRAYRLKKDLLKALRIVEDRSGGVVHIAGPKVWVMMACLGRE